MATLTRVEGQMICTLQFQGIITISTVSHAKTQSDNTLSLWKLESIVLQNITADDISWIKSKNLLSSTTGKSYYKQRMEKSNKHVERGVKKITISLSRAVNVSKIKSLILEMPGHIQLSVIISRWKDHLLSKNTSIDGSKKALVYSMKHPWLNRKKCCPYIDAWQANSLTNQDRGDRMCLGASASTPSCIFSPWPTCQHLHIF